MKSPGKPSVFQTLLNASVRMRSERNSVHAETDLVTLVKKAMRTVKATEDTAGVVLATRLPERAIVSAIPLKSNWLL